MPPRITLVTATQRRPEPLARALRSLFAQEGVNLARVELVVADNDRTPSGRAVVETLAAVAPFPVLYVHEPRPGVSNARNAALAQAGGELVAFLDDDQEAQPRWLAELLATRERLDADAVFGPVRGAVPPGVTRHRRYFERFFSHPGPAEEGPSALAYGAGVCLVVRASLPDPHAPFAASRNETGGEDDALFAAMLDRGARFGWNPRAWVWEHPAPERVTLAYALRRSFVYGQGGTNRRLLRSPPDRLGAAASMATGMAQAMVMGALSAALWLVRAPDRAFAYDKAMRGLGKVLHAPRFRLQFYGLEPGRPAGGALRRRAARAAPG